MLYFVFSDAVSVTNNSLRYVPPAQGMPSYYSKAADTAHSGADPDTAVHDGYLARAVIAPGIYYFGIVDILQTWSFSKKMEKYYCHLCQ